MKRINGMFCLEWDDSDPFIINGNFEDDNNFVSLDLAFIPCNVLTGSAPITPECIANRDKQTEYLGKVNLNILTN